MEVIGKNRHRELANSKVCSLRFQLLFNPNLTVRYLATGSIYMASTAEVFLQGISEAPWLPIVLAGLSVVGILAGIALHIRAMLWLEAMFMCVAMFAVIWHAAVDMAQTWVWYVSGIVMGVLILTMFALFEKRREQLKGLISTLQTWDD